jgi:hypothetical protein
MATNERTKPRPRSGQRGDPINGPGFSSVLSLFFSPERFVRTSLESDAQATAEELARRGANVDSDWREENRFAWRERAKIVRRAWWCSALLGLVTVGTGWTLGWLLSHVSGSPRATLLLGLQYAGIGIVLFATIAKVGWYSPSFGGRTYLEKTDLLMFRCACCLGSGLMVLSVSWP